MNGTIRYTIRPYDTIWMLAQVFNTTVDSILDLNPGIEPRNLMIGQVVTLRPGYQSYPSYSDSPMENDTQGMQDDGMDDDIMDEDLMSGDMMDDDMSGNTSDLVNYFRLLWEQHVEWTRMAVMGIVHQLPEADKILQRLLRNATDFANAFAPFYGEDAAKEFERLFTEHITIAGDLVKAIMAGDNNAVTEADQKWHENADQIAAFMNKVNRYWREDDWSAMLYEHLDLLASNIENMIAKNYEESINGYDEIEMQAMEMADMMVEGLTMQFPG
ncbi:MAG: hypothetical protein H6Q59_2490 [Firmicutes bacterium]|nr:hypothetical protein [Bacillota bacterium]